MAEGGKGRDRRLMRLMPILAAIVIGGIVTTMWVAGRCASTEEPEARRALAEMGTRVVRP